MEESGSVNTLLTFAGILVGVIAVFVGFLLHWKNKFENQETKYKDNVSKLQAECAEKLAGASTPALQDLQSRVNLPVIREMLTKRLADITQLNIELDIVETSKVWSQLFRESQTVFLRATSLIDPEIWEDEFMRKYAGEQRKLVEQIQTQKHKNRSDYEAMVSKVRAKVSDRLPEFNDFETNFERIFIIRNEQLASSTALRKLADLIASQSGYMSVRVVHEKRVAASDMKDFGVVVSREGDVLVYELNIVGGTLYGGRVFYQSEKATEAFERYNSIVALAVLVPQNSTSSEVLDMLAEVSGAVGTIIHERVLEEAKAPLSIHKCLYCFLSTEVAMGLLGRRDWAGFPLEVVSSCETAAAQYEHKDWRDLPADDRRWFEMTDVENRKVLQHVEEHRPKRILEVGCGPGRLISQILTIEDYEYDEIVGIEGNEHMYNIAYQRFPPIEYPRVTFYHMTVKSMLPYGDDYFDFCINAMNIIGWQRNKELDWLKEMVRCSCTTFFTLYKSGYEQERLRMYLRRPHRRDGVRLDPEVGQIQLADCATNPGVYSGAYSRSQVDSLCRAVADRYEPEYAVDCTIDDSSNELLFLCLISKTKK